MIRDIVKVPGPLAGLSVKMITAITLVILLVEVAVFLPSLANFRVGWLEDRLRVGGVAIRVFDAVPNVMDIPAEITDPLLQSAGAIAIVYRREGQTDLIVLDAITMPEETHLADLRDTNPVGSVIDALDTLIFGGQRTLRIVGTPPGAGDAVVEVLMPESPLRTDLLTYAGNIALVSIVIAGVTAFVIYILTESLLIGPIKRLTAEMLAFRENPENGTLVIVPEPGRKDEVGVLERALADTQTELFAMLRQRRHLADLGMAVSKINHDLRNMLTSAQLLSDQVATLDDPQVQRLAPRLVNTLDKAIAFAQTVLDYGRQQSAPPQPQPVDLRALGFEAALSSGVAGHPRVNFDNKVPDDLVVSVDPDQLARVLVNIFKNAREALETAGPETSQPEIRFSATDGVDHVRLLIADNGPGLPPRARENLFVAFEGSARAGGTGLGLAIARELIEANGGTIELMESQQGTVFAIDLPSGSMVR